MSSVALRIRNSIAEAIIDLQNAQRMSSPTDARLNAELVAAKQYLESAALLIDARLDPNPEWYGGDVGLLVEGYKDEF